MTAQRLAALLMIGGSVVFVVGAAIGVPAAFTERDPATRLRLLQDKPQQLAAGSWHNRSMPWARCW
jgi:hypothetical protein